MGEFELFEANLADRSAQTVKMVHFFASDLTHDINLEMLSMD